MRWRISRRSGSSMFNSCSAYTWGVDVMGCQANRHMAWTISAFKGRQGTRPRLTGRNDHGVRRDIATYHAIHLRTALSAWP
jgi:hypothetical protein